MGKEIERKYLVQQGVKAFPGIGNVMHQGYIPTKDNTVVRVRTESRGDCYICIKGETKGITRSEFEYKIPKVEAEDILLTLCDNIISKTRYIVQYNDDFWEVDVFHGDNDGLVTAELELEYETQEIVLPPWIEMEVSDDPKYYNSSLAELPYKDWK